VNTNRRPYTHIERGTNPLSSIKNNRAAGSVGRTEVLRAQTFGR
jgi:hypothetical protein